MTMILLLEDNADMLAMLKQVLEWGDYEVRGCRGGVEGLAALATEPPPDIIISDMKMPDLDGLSFLKTVRERDSWSHIPIILMSGSHERDRALAGGADDFLNKPFSLESFQAVLNRWNI